MNVHLHEAARCQNGANCTGPGCRITTGKTQRKANWARPKKNKHEGDRASTAPKKGSK